MFVANHRVLTSAQNPLLKDVRKAVLRGGLTSEGYCVAETSHLLEEARRSDCEIGTVLASESSWPNIKKRYQGVGPVRVFVLSDSLLRTITALESSQGVIALVRPPAWKLEQLLAGRSPLVVLDGVQDPGNAGAIVRASEAFGAAGVLFLKGTADPYNPKTLRASAGSMFRVPVVCGVEEIVTRSALEAGSFTTYATTPTAEQALDAVRFPAKTAFIIGREGCGVSEGWLANARTIRIPTEGVESLNASVAAGIVLYEASRQRRVKP